MTNSLVVAVLACGMLCAQPAHFEVASIKPGAPGGSATGAPRGVLSYPGCAPPFGAQPGPLQYVLLNCAVRDLVGRSGLDLNRAL
jgi:hypothetical protein